MLLFYATSIAREDFLFLFSAHAALLPLEKLSMSHSSSEDPGSSYAHSNLCSQHLQPSGFRRGVTSPLILQGQFFFSNARAWRLYTTPNTGSKNLTKPQQKVKVRNKLTHANTKELKRALILPKHVRNVYIYPYISIYQRAFRRFLLLQNC